MQPLLDRTAFTRRLQKRLEHLSRRTALRIFASFDQNRRMRFLRSAVVGYQKWCVLSQDSTAESNFRNSSASARKSQASPRNQNWNLSGSRFR